MTRHIRAAAAAFPLLLAGCNSGVDPSGLAPLTGEPARIAAPLPADGGASGEAMAGQAAALAPPAAPRPTQASAAAPGVAAIAAQARIEFAPVVGAEASRLQSLSARLAARAAQRGLTLVGADGAPTHVLKGYFSAFTDNGDTAVIYVWDVLDRAGNRVNRIQGQQKAPTAPGLDGWSAVTPAVMEAIADRTIDDLAAWLSGATG